MRNKLLFLNTITSLLFQATTIICGFIVPRLILKHYGSEVNGLVNSIVQYLAIIGFLEFGVGAVVQSSLYKPLADNDQIGISKIIVSATNFFRNLAYILLIYVCILIAIYPLCVQSEFNFLYTATLIITLSISSFSQYYFGIVDRLLLTAAQLGYVQFVAQIITLIINTVTCVVLIELDASIHIVKLTASLIFLTRPLYLRWYTNKIFKLNRNIEYDIEPIKQKWNGAAQHFASVVLDGTAMIILTTFSTLINVSIYSVYWLVIFGFKQLCLSLTSGIQAVLGDLWAKQEIKELQRTFGWVEWSIHTTAVFLFGCTAVLITPFVSVYTQGVNDANYLQPVFGITLTLAHLGHCFRLPYNLMILAAGHYKETQHNYVIAATSNLAISCLLVINFGIIGVAVGAAIALYYQTVWMALYVSKHLIKWPFQYFIKQIFVDVITLLTAGISSFYINTNCTNYIDWICIALKISIVWLSIIIIINLLFYKENLTKIKNAITKKIYIF